jgi:hypothetical protein
MLNGVFEPWESASPFVREFLKELQCTVEHEMNIDLLLGEFIQLFKTIPENTASSVSGLHYGHYKVLSKMDDDAYIRVLFEIVEIAFITHSPLPRWKYATQLMLEKGKGPAIENLRIIQLLEADMNWLLRSLWGRRLNHHAQTEGVYSEDQYAAPGKLCWSAILNKVIYFDLLRQMRQCGALMDNDATAAFDRVLPALCVVTCRQLGMPKQAQRFFFRLLRQMEYTVTTAHGRSSATYSANANPKVPGQGVIQGGGASQPNFNSQQHPVLKSVEANCTPAIFPHASRSRGKVKRWLGGFSDDMGLFLNDLGVTSTPGDYSIPIAQRVQRALQSNISRYEAYFNAAGGSLNVKKCFYYLVSFIWSGSEWRYQTNAEMAIDPVVITPTTLDNSGLAQPVAWLEANDAQRTLGAYIAPDGSFHRQLDVLHDKFASWKLCLRNMHTRNLRAKWLSYKNVFLRRIMYPLIGHSFGYDDLQSIQKPVDVEILHILGLNEHFPRAVLRAPLLFGGLGCTTIHGQHIIDKLVLFVHHIRENSRIAEVLLTSMSITQLECGTANPFFDLDPAIWSPLVTPTWITHLWCECKTANVDVKFFSDLFWTPAPTRQNDICIMDIASTMYSGRDLIQINQCRIFLQATYFSDITSVDGKRILLSYYLGKGHSDTGRSSRLNWPPMGSLPQQHWALWQEFLERRCGTSLRLPTRLGSWFQTSEILTRICFFTIDRRLILQDKDRLLEFPPYSPRSRTRFQLESIPFIDEFDIHRVQAVDITIKNGSIFILSQHNINDLVLSHSSVTPSSIIDLFAQLPSPLQRLIGNIEWPPPETLSKIADSIKAGTLIGASDGSVRYADSLASHAWILQTPDGSELAGHGPVDGAERYRTSHRAELQGQAALFLMISLLAKFYEICSGKLQSFCDNQPVVTKMKRGWRMLRLRHIKGPDSDIQAILRTTLASLRDENGVTYSAEWVRSHQDKIHDLRSLPREIALNIRMDDATKTAYDLPQRWLTQETVPVYQQEGCAVYLDNIKITSSLSSTLADHWHTAEAKQYLLERHGITDQLLRNIHWPSLRFSLQKFSSHRRATLVKAIHRHLPTQQKLFQQGRIAMSSLCPRCLHADETNSHIYCCPDASAVQQRKALWTELLKQLTRNRTSLIILKTWSTYLLPLLGLPAVSDITSSMPVIDDDISFMLRCAIHDQTEIGWDKLMLGFSSSLWKSLQSGIDSYNPKAPQRTAIDWLNVSVYHLQKFSLRCWKARNAAVHGTTKQEQQRIALDNTRARITALYAAPPPLDPQFRPISDVPLTHRLRLPLQAAEHWLSLIQHQIKVTTHNLKVLLKQHISIPTHVSNMQNAARRQRYERRQPETPRKAHRRAVQAANKLMRERLYAPKANRNQQRRHPSRSKSSRPPHDATTIRPVTTDATVHPTPRHHPP